MTALSAMRWSSGSTVVVTSAAPRGTLPIAPDTTARTRCGAPKDGFAATTMRSACARSSWPASIMPDSAMRASTRSRRLRASSGRRSSA